MKKKAIITIIGWMISIACIWSIFARMNLSALLNGFGQAKWGWLVFATIINLIVMAVKALRWQMIMTPPVRAELVEAQTTCPSTGSGRTVSFWTSLKAAFISCAGNNVLPARGGDMLRIYLLGKWADTSKAIITSVTALDKLFDGLSILILFGFFSIFSFGLGKGTFPAWVRHGTIVISILIAVSLIICFFLLFHHKRTDETKDLGWIAKLAKNLGSGMGMLTSKGLVSKTILASLLSSLIQIITIWSCQMAFGIHFNLWVAATVFVAINLAITIPSAPSGVGPFEAAAVLTYTWLHLKTETAFNIALMYHAVQFFPVTILGFLFYLKSASLSSSLYIPGKRRGRLKKRGLP